MSALLSQKGGGGVGRRFLISSSSLVGWSSKRYPAQRFADVCYSIGSHDSSQTSARLQQGASPSWTAALQAILYYVPVHPSERLTRLMLRRQGVSISNARISCRTFSYIRSPLRLRSSLIKEVPSGAAITVQRVRFTKPPLFTWRRLTRFLIYYVIPTYAIIQFAPIVVELEVEDQSERLGGSVDVDVQRNKKSKGGEKKDEEDEWFIPLTLAQELPRTYYKASDPEWQEFEKFMRDKAKRKKVTDSFASHVRKSVANSPRVASQVGQTDSKNVLYLLSFHLPESPPREYVRSGLKIAGNGIITWDRQIISQAQYKSKKRKLLPYASFRAFLAAGNHVFFQLLKGVQEVSASNYTAVSKRFQAHLDQRRNGATNEKGSTSPSTRAEKSDDTTEKQMSARSSSHTSQNAPSGSPNPDERHAWIPRLPGMSNDQPETLRTFMRSMHENQEKYIIPITIDPPRGTIILTGSVVVRGTKGEITVSVWTAYDPAKNVFWDPHLASGGVRPHRPRPKGGA